MEPKSLCLPYISLVKEGSWARRERATLSRMGKTPENMKLATAIDYQDEDEHLGVSVLHTQRRDDGLEVKAKQAMSTAKDMMPVTRMGL